MKETNAFSFRQRVGAINFHAVTSVSLQKVITSNDIGELQKLLDTVTFSNFTEDDCKGQSIGAVTKLVHVMQLIIEYMLNAQNAQLNAIIDKSQQIKSLIHANKKLEIDKLKLKENLKSAEHSMATLKSSLIKAHDIIRFGPDMELKNAFHEDPIVVFDPRGNQPNPTEEPSSSSILTSPKSIAEQFAPVVENLVKEQAQVTKSTIQGAIETHRSAFSKELEVVTKGWQEMFEQALKSHRMENSASSPAVSKSSHDLESSPSKGSLSKAHALDSILMEREKAVQNRELDINRRDAALTKQFEALEARERKLADMERTVSAQSRKLEAARMSLENGRIDLVEKMTEANTNAYEKQIESFVSLGEKIADSISRKKAQKIGTNMICTKFKNLFERHKSKAFNLWRSCMLKQRAVDKELLLEKLKEEVIDSHSRENEIVAMLQSERRKAQAEQLKLHEAVRNAEVEKKEAIVKAEEEISEALHKQLELVSNAVSNKVSAGTSTSKSIEIASLRQSYQQKEMQLQIQLELEKRQEQELLLKQQEIVNKRKNEEEETSRKQQNESQSKLVEILPEDLLRNSNEEALLSQAMSRIRRASVSKIDASEIQNSLAKEIKEKF